MAAAERIRIGNQTAFSAIPFDRPFRYAIDQAFDAFEWFPDKKNGGGWMAGDVPGPQRQSFRDAARAQDMRISMHASCGVNPARPDHLEQLEQDRLFARDAGAVLMVVHACLEDGLDEFAAALEPLLERLAPPGISLAIENTPLTGPGAINDLFRRIAGRLPDRAAGAGLCFDMGHANVCAATRNDYLGFIDALGSHVPIVHVHAHENRGDADSHETLFTGPSAGDPAGIRGLVGRLADRGYAGSIILEQWPEPPGLLVAARDRLRAMIDGVPPHRPAVARRASADP